MKHVIAINGSPRGKNSTTYAMVEAFLSGMRKCGWLDRHVLLSNMNIHHCIGCLHCWRSGGECAFHDDRQHITFHNCDLVIFATPVYCANITGLLKNFLDRSVASSNPLIGQDKNYESIHPHSSPRPKILAMANCGFPEESSFDVLRMLFRHMARIMECELVGEIYRSQGPLLQGYNSEHTTIIEAYMALLETAGREMGQSLSLSNETKRRLEQPLIPPAAYIAQHNAYFETQMQSPWRRTKEV